jgi:hypothetical protein
MEQYIKPRWLRDLLRFLPLKSQFVLSGNVKDLQTQEISPRLIAAAPLIDVLAAELKNAGFTYVLVYDPLTGIRLADPLIEVAEAAKVLERLGIPPSDSNIVASADVLAPALDRVISTSGPPTAIIIDFASRLIVRTDYPSPSEHQLFTRALVLTQSAKARPVGPNRHPLFNTVLWVVDKEGDLPDWLVINNPRLRHIPISKPDRAARRAITPALLRGLVGGQHASDAVLAQAEEDLVDETEGLLLTDLNAIVLLGRSEQVEVSRISDAVRRYIVADITWRSTNQSLVSMLGTKFRHIEANVGTLVSKQ